VNKKGTGWREKVFKTLDGVSHFIRIIETRRPRQGGELIMAYKITVDKDKCDACESCVDICPAEVLEMVDGKAEPVNMDECMGCESCVETCPNEAITLTDE
jgi:NAD-dependent dihydropyrimidine dehydrogenase PreA subunit